MSPWTILEIPLLLYARENVIIYDASVSMTHCCNHHDTPSSGICAMTSSWRHRSFVTVKKGQNLILFLLEPNLNSVSMATPSGWNFKNTWFSLASSWLFWLASKHTLLWWWSLTREKTRFWLVDRNCLFLIGSQLVTHSYWLAPPLCRRVKKDHLDHITWWSCDQIYLVWWIKIVFL